MTIDLAPAVPITAPSFSKATVDHIAKLKREADFYQSAWEEVLPFIKAMGKQLVNSWGFERIPDASAGDTYLHLVLSSHTTNSSSTSSSIHLELPASIHSFLTRQPFPPTHSDTVIRADQPVHIGPEAIGIPPLLDIVNMLQCFLPGIIDVPTGTGACGVGQEDREGEGRNLPEVKWLLEKELILREAFGCTYFRYMIDAAREQ